jgi:hypothetical protein
MVQVAGQTYRIVKRAPGEYEVFRILDDVRVGTFESQPHINVTAEQGVDPDLVKLIAVTALKIGKITWARRGLRAS